MAQTGAGQVGVKSEQLCLHLEQAEGLTLHADEGYFELPLNKNLVALRGQVCVFPNVFCAARRARGDQARIPQQKRSALEQRELGVCI